MPLRSGGRGSGILAGFPFVARPLTGTLRGVRPRLGSDSPDLVRRSIGNLLHLGPPGSTEVQATTITISTRGRSSRPRERPSALTASPPYPSTRPSLSPYSPRRTTERTPRRRRTIGRPIKRHPFSGPHDSAGELLHTPQMMSTSMTTSRLSPSHDALSGVPFSVARHLTSAGG